MRKELLSHGLPCNRCFVDEQNIQTKVQEWAKEIGERAAQSRLIKHGASPNTAQKLTSGRYTQHKVGTLLMSAIERAMSEEAS